jgi:hypothetical protein
MENSRSYNGQFKQYAFAWRSAFSQRQTNLYRSEEQRYVSSFVEDGHELSTGDLIDGFVHIQCQHDIDRYMYRKLQLSEFLEAADLQTLRREPIARTSRPKVLVDDRNNRIVTRDNLVGKYRRSDGALTAQQFYSELLKAVSLPILSFEKLWQTFLTYCQRTALIDNADAERRLM